MSNKKFNVGDKVKYIGTKHDIYPQWFPIVGTIGTVLQDVGEVDCYIQWSKGSTSENDCWYCDKQNIELVKNTDMTNEEIWKMLRPKFNKNNLEGNYIRIDRYGNIKEDAYNAIAIAYRSGYERAIKGRPFKIGEKKEKKQGGHWEPVDPNNLPKEGTRVRYSRKCGKYKDDIIKIGDTGTVVFEGIFTPLWFGMKPDKLRSGRTWFDFSEGDENCLDMWVGDNE